MTLSVKILVCRCEDNASESEIDEYCSDEDVRLVDCEDVKFEFRDEMAGVSFTKDGEEGWDSCQKENETKPR